MKKTKYADTIRIKADSTAEQPHTAKKPMVRLNAFNRLFCAALFAPAAAIVYYPFNRYIAVPKLGTGAPYVDMNGALIEDYFSANTLARILFYLLFAASEFLLIRNAGAVHGWKKIAVLFLGTLLNLIGGILFLEFSLWRT